MMSKYHDGLDVSGEWWLESGSVESEMEAEEAMQNTADFNRRLPVVPQQRDRRPSLRRKKVDKEI